MITLIFGSQGSGKTLFMTKEAYNHWKNGFKIISNFDLAIPHTRLEIEDILQAKLDNASVFIDECHIFGGFNARRSLSKENVKVTGEFLSQIRKQNISLYMSSQLPRNIDARARENAHWLIFCSKKIFVNGLWVDSLNDREKPSTKVMIQTDILHVATEKYTTLRFIANDYFGLYDTKELVRNQLDN